MTIKEIRDIKTNELTGYNLDGMYVPLDPSNRHYQEIQEVIKKGVKVEPAYTDEERFDYFKTIKKQEIKSALQNYLKSYTLTDGTIIENGIQDQANNLKNLNLSQMAMQSPKWAKSTEVALNSVVFIGNVLCICVTAGTTGSSEPTAPTEFGVAITDNMVEWKKLGFLVNTDKGRIYFTPQDIIKISQEIAFILNEALTKYDNLKMKIDNATTQDDLDKIVWS